MAQPSTADIVAISPVIPVVVIKEAQSAVPLAEALIKGGISVIEITLRTSAGLEAIERVAAEVPDMTVGAGTVTTPDHVGEVTRAGASFIVLPGSPDALLSAALDSGLPVLPGASSVTEVMTLAERGQVVQKFFPAQACGGVASLSAFTGPLPDIRFCPTGGVSASNAAAYLELANVACVGGSWLTPPDAMASGDWERITALAAAASSLASASPVGA